MSKTHMVHPDLHSKTANCLESLWLEVAPVCHLKCEYCFSEVEQLRNTRPLTIEEIEHKVLRPFKEGGGRWVAIPGAGEPLLRRVLPITKHIVELTKQLELELTVFTSGDMIDAELAQYLYGHSHVAVMVKWNSSDAAVQDKMVGDATGQYTKRRREGWGHLSREFKDSRQRLGIVTSILRDNCKEIVDILCFARKEDVRFDCDLILPRGRGLHSDQVPDNDDVRHVVEKLRRADAELGMAWSTAGAYINAPCKRYRNHLYVRYDGQVVPCVGGFSVDLGNVRTRELNEIWNSATRQAYVNRTVMGACAVCDKFEAGNCSSCIGRNADPEELKETLPLGWINTSPCALFLPQLALTLQAANLYIRKVLSSEVSARGLLDEGLENFWRSIPPVCGRNEELDMVATVRVSLFDMIRKLTESQASVKEVMSIGDMLREYRLVDLLSKTSPISLCMKFKSGKTMRLVLSSTGFPQLLEETDGWWGLPTPVLNGELKEAIEDLLKRAEGCTESPSSWEFLVRRDLRELVLAAMASRGRDTDDLAGWVPVPIYLRVPGDDRQNRARERVIGYELQYPERQLRLSPRDVGLGKFTAFSGLRCDWNQWYERGVSAFGPLFAEAGAEEEDGSPELCNLLPRLLGPLTQLALNGRDLPTWIVWLFYDPCKNAYFRRLFVNTEVLNSEQQATLRLLYLWPEPNRRFAETFSEDPAGVALFERSVLNLSDMLRDPLLDYELLLEESTGAMRPLGSAQFGIKDLLQDQEIERRAKALVTQARKAWQGMSPKTQRTLHFEPLSDWRRTKYHEECAHEFLAALKSLAECLVPADSDDTILCTLFEKLPPGLRTALGRHRRVMASESERSPERLDRVINYFIWLAALRRLGVKHYYVFQHLSHNLVPGAGRGYGRATTLTPSGFIIASDSMVSDHTIADLRLVFESVHAPFVEQYAAWVSDYDRARGKVLRNMPCLQRFPLHYVHKLANYRLTPDRRLLVSQGEPSGSVGECDAQFLRDRTWIRRIPKADLHVHLGPAIPTNVVYDLALITLYHATKGDAALEGRVKKFLVSTKKHIGKALSVMTRLKVRQRQAITTDVFKDCLVNAACEDWGAAGIHSINSMLSFEAKKAGLSEELGAACLVVLLGCLVRNRKRWKESIALRTQRLAKFYKYLEDIRKREVPKPAAGVLDHVRKTVCAAYLVPCEHLVMSALKPYDVEMDETEETWKEIERCLYEDFFPSRDVGDWQEKWGDPLSSLLSVPRAFEGRERGLGRYLGGSALTGSSVLQHYDTLALAVIETALHAARTDTIRYMELKVAPVSLLGGGSESEELVLLTALLGLAYVTDAGVAYACGLVSDAAEDMEKVPYVLANVIVAGKRNKGEEHLRAAVRQAVDVRERYLEARKEHFVGRTEVGREGERRDKRRRGEPESALVEIGTQQRRDIFVPRVVGIDLVGRERGVRHAELRPAMMEAFEKSLAIAVHAGEDEDERSIWEAVYELHAQRIGHGLRIRATAPLMGLLGDRRIPVELCPYSNQYTNGFHFAEGKQYVFVRFRKEDVTVTINTDDPWISHRLVEPVGAEHQPYPLSEEYMALPLMFRDEDEEDGKKDAGEGKVSRLEVLRLVFNGFDNAFLPSMDRQALLELADLETFHVLVEADLRYQAEADSVLE